MADLTAPKPRTFRGAMRSKIAFPVEANTAIWAGMAVFVNGNGGLAACTPTASGKFAGFANESKDNRTGNGLYSAALGGVACECDTDGLVELSVARASSTYVRTDVGSTVYASDSDTFTTDAGTNNIVVGKIAVVPEAAVGAGTATLLVRFESIFDRSI